MFRKLFYLLLILIVPLLFIGFADYQGLFWHNEFLSDKYKVKGIDASHYQGLINWTEVANDNISFAFIKATEGTGHIDSYFSYNWEESKRVGIYRGAYHFFSMKSSGKAQGKYFISVVDKDNYSLPPAIDVEVDLSYYRERVLREVGDMSDILEAHYGQKPILYMNLNTYKAFFKDSEAKNKLWIRNIYNHPNFAAKTNWRFWQYSDKGQVIGIEGKVDLNVYRGSFSDFLYEFNLK